MSERVSLFIAIFTIINVIACMWLLWWTARTRGNSDTHGQGAKTEGPERTGHVWDGDLEEYNNPLPRWWLGLFVITVIFGAVYLYYFPGLGNFTGASGWSSLGEYEAQVSQQRALLDQQLASLHDASLEQMAANHTAMATAKNLFGANCSTCHGSDARGAKGFPNLTDSDWLWGTPDLSVYETIANGRHAVMPPLGAVLGPQGVNEVASYVVSLSGVKAPAEWIASGRDRFATVCAGCHGGDAKGNALIGAPNLTDKTWLFGGDFDTVRATIANGRESTMPAHSKMLGDTKVKLLAAYVLSLSGPAAAATQTAQSDSTGAASGAAP
ncbi:MAG: cytochrome-c oxidase, cbb3-type subunit III [Povalibacter sp.]